MRNKNIVNTVLVISVFVGNLNGAGVTWTWKWTQYDFKKEKSTCSVKKIIKNKIKKKK